MSKTDSHYWFKRRRYGYGWVPVRWQGWLALGICLLAITGAAFIFTDRSYSTLGLWLYLVTVFIAVATLLILAVIKGPSPKWRWGKKPGDNPKEDF